MRPFLIASALLTASISASTPLTVPHWVRPDVPIAAGEDYRTSAGHMVGDTLVATLEMQTARWRSQGDAAVEVPVYVFAEPGKAPRVPGPMLRLREGGVLRLTLRNTLDRRTVVRGLQPRPFSGAAVDSIVLLPGRDTTIVMRAGAPGSYFYWARTTPTVNHSVAPIPGFLWGGEKEEGPFVGALIVDGANERIDPRERTFVITRWLDEKLPGINDTLDWKMSVNGGSFPNTEHLDYTVGDVVRWRVINASLTSHPMHLHGFYYKVTARGKVGIDSAFAPNQQRKVVTELMDGGESMRMEWTPERPGNWLFHCHLIRHMSAWQNLPRAASGPSVSHDDGHGHSMAGLVMGITVHARAGRDSLAAERMARGDNAVRSGERAIRLLAQTRPSVFGNLPGYSFVVQRGAMPALDSIVRPSPTLVLKRGEPVRITVRNNIAVPLAVHWHGMELESWFDGVGGFSGMGKTMRAPISPRDSFVVRFTPPRAGTFMFHTHDEPGHELASGLNGALLVVNDPAAFDRTRDHTFLLATRGPNDSGMVVVNGTTAPAPIAVAPGVTQRFRFAAISSNERLDVSLVKRDSVSQWRVVARDGAELPASQLRTARARLLMSAGITTDVEFTLPASEATADGSTPYALRVHMRVYEAFDLPGSTLTIPIVVRR